MTLDLESKHFSSVPFDRMIAASEFTDDQWVGSVALTLVRICPSKVVSNGKCNQSSHLAVRMRFRKSCLQLPPDFISAYILLLQHAPLGSGSAFAYNGLATSVVGDLAA